MIGATSAVVAEGLSGCTGGLVRENLTCSTGFVRNTLFSRRKPLSAQHFSRSVISLQKRHTSINPE